MTDREFERRMEAAASNHAAGVRRDLLELSAEMKAADAALRRKRDAATLERRTCVLRAVLDVADQLRAVSALARSAADASFQREGEHQDRMIRAAAAAYSGPSK